MTELMNTLEGAAVDAAAGTTSQARETQSVDVADAGNEVNVAAVDVDDADAASDAEEDAEPSVTVDPNLSEQGKYHIASYHLTSIQSPRQLS